MLPAPHRLREDRVIKRVMARGQYVSAPTLVVRIASGQSKKTRATVVAGLRVHKRANERNLVKRRVREALRALLPEIKSGLDIVVTARAEAVGKSFSDLGNDLYEALLRLGVIPVEKFRQDTDRKIIHGAQGTAKTNQDKLRRSMK